MTKTPRDDFDDFSNRIKDIILDEVAEIDGNRHCFTDRQLKIIYCIASNVVREMIIHHDSLGNQ